MLIRTDTLKPWDGEPVNDVSYPRNIETAWSAEELATAGLAKVKAFVPPGGKQIVPGSTPTYSSDGTETYPVEDAIPVRVTVPKSTVQTRLIDAGKMGIAYAMLTQNPAAFARWFAPDHPAVYSDDPDAVAFVTALGLDPAVVLAPGTS